MRCFARNLLFLLILALIVISLRPALAADPVAPFPEATSGSKIIIEISLSELPKVRIIPSSPLFFLKTLWESARLFVSKDPEGKASLAVQYAQERLAEALRFSGSTSSVVMVEKLFRERTHLLERAHQLAGSDEEIRQKILEQLVLGKEFLLRFLDESASEEQHQRVQNLVDWQESWMVGLEKGLDEEVGEAFENSRPLEGTSSGMSFEATVSALPLSTPSAQKVGEGFFRKLWRSIFGYREKLLSPLAIPGKD